MSFTSPLKYESIDDQAGGGDDDVTDAYLSKHKKTSVKRRLTKLMNLSESSPSRKVVFSKSANNVQFWKETCEDPNEPKKSLKCATVLNISSINERDLKRLESINKIEIEDFEKVIESLPEELTNSLKNISHFSLSWSKIKLISKEIMHSKLKCLKLKDNRIKNVWGLNSAHNLEILVIRNNSLVQTPSHLCELSNLTYLDLSGNSIKALPEDFGKLKNLILLDLSRNKLKTLPSSIADLKSLEIFKINNNMMFSLDITLSKLTSLKDLQASSNQLNQLPLSFESFQALQSISLSYNYFKNIPNSLCSLKNLKIANFRNNQIQVVSDAYPHLSCLNLNNNFLKQIPDSIINSSNITHLYLNNNYLSTIPDSTSQLENLQVLHLDNNPDLKRLPNTLRNLTSLKHLSITNTNIPANNQTIQELLREGVTVHVNVGLNLFKDLKGATLSHNRPQCSSIYPIEFKSISDLSNQELIEKDDRNASAHRTYVRNQRCKTEAKRYGRLNI